MAIIFVRVPTFYFLSILAFFYLTVRISISGYSILQRFTFNHSSLSQNASVLSSTVTPRFSVNPKIDHISVLTVGSLLYRCFCVACVAPLLRCWFTQVNKSASNEWRADGVGCPLVVPTSPRESPFGVGIALPECDGIDATPFQLRPDVGILYSWRVGSVVWQR